MLYTQQLIEKAITTFYPNYALNKGIAIPEALKTAAIEIFCNGERYQSTDNFFERGVIKEGLLEIRKYGFLSYGEINEYWK